MGGADTRKGKNWEGGEIYGGLKMSSGLRIYKEYHFRGYLRNRIGASDQIMSLVSQSQVSVLTNHLGILVLKDSDLVGLWKGLRFSQMVPGCSSKFTLGVAVTQTSVEEKPPQNGFRRCWRGENVKN